MQTKMNDRRFTFDTMVLLIGGMTGLLIAIGCDANSASRSLGLTSIVPTSDDDEEKVEQKDESKKEDENDLLKDWKKPLFALFVTGRQSGYIEPCGCTGLYNQKGGLMRRHRVQQLLTKLGWDLILIDAGNQIRRFGQQPVIKLHHTWDGLCNVMKYAAIGFGPDDLKTPTIDLVQTMSNVTDNTGQFVCANVNPLGADLQNTFVIVEKAGKKIGITHALDDESIESLKNKDELEVKSLAESLPLAARMMAGCDLKVLMLQTDAVDTANQVAAKYPFFDLLVHTTSAGEPEKLPTTIQTGDHVTSLIQVGVKGMYIGVVAYYEEAGKLTMKHERVPLDGRFTDSKPMEKIFENYQNELKSLYLAGKLLDIKPKPHPSGFKFVGSEACFDCHQVEFEIWENGVDGEGGPHFIATDDIVEPPNHRGHIARHFDPECISCHATGWNPQDMYPYETGFIDLKKDAHLHGNGCENCHGPGSAHVAIEQAKDRGQQFPAGRLDELRLAMRLTLEQAKNDHCIQCHDADNSPDFLKEGAFEKYWPKIEH